jgi:hypothetical protein
MSRYKQEQFYNAELLCEEAIVNKQARFYDAELLCEEAIFIFTLCTKKRQVKK